MPYLRLRNVARSVFFLISNTPMYVRGTGLILGHGKMVEDDTHEIGDDNSSRCACHC